MKIQSFAGIPYKLPDKLNEFQMRLYVHLINWKWKYITNEVGLKNKIPYDAILPESMGEDFPLIYPSVLSDLKSHKEIFSFKLHLYFNHMASSQAANANLFLPILLNSKANDILKQLIPDFSHLAIDQLYKGFRIEFWDGNSDDEKGLLRDHNAKTGTDSDIAIAYYTRKGELRLWLIEHKQVET